MERTANAGDSGMLSLKVISIAAGEAHTLALTGDGKLYSWGRGTFGRLGTGSEDEQLVPIQVKFFGSDDDREENCKIVGIAAGAYHSLALADDGSFWGWGCNVCGQIGDTGETSLVPQLLDSFLGLCSSDSATKGNVMKNGKPLQISSVKAGGMMSMAIDGLGSLWMWGSCCPHPSQSECIEEQTLLVSSTATIPVCYFHGHTVVKVACGSEHVVALVSAGETYAESDTLCYSWGGNSSGQLGLGDEEGRSSPEVIEAFNLESSWEVYDISCGSFHTAVLTRRKRPSNTFESVCWTFGLGDNGQLGHGTTQCFLSPELVQGLPQNTSLTSVGCGLFHTSVASSTGEVWSWGMEKGLGLCPDARFTGSDSGDAISPLLIPCNGMHSPRFQAPVQVVCGAAHTVLVADSGYKLFSWGRGRNGVLGNGKTVDCCAPTIVLWPLHAEDFKERESNTVMPREFDSEKSPEKIVEMEERLSAAMNEITSLRSKLFLMERYASLLHGSIFGKPFQEQDIPPSLQTYGVFDIGKEWESMLELSDHSKLIRLETFYSDMLAGVKDKLLKRRIQELVKESLNANAMRRTYDSDAKIR